MTVAEDVRPIEVTQLPEVLLPYQKRWIADESSVKIFNKSRRIGATWCEAADDVLIAARQDFPQDIWFISYAEDPAREYIRDAAEWAKAYELAASDVNETLFEDKNADGTTRNIKAFVIYFASGKRITALSSRPRNLRGKQGVAVLDEFAHHDDAPGLMKAAVAFLMWGGRVRIMSTHNGIDSHFNTLIEENRKGRNPYSLHQCDFDDACKDGLFSRVCLRTGQKNTLEAEAKWREEILSSYKDNLGEELYCTPRESGGCYFPRLLVEQNMSDDIPVFNLAFKNEFTMYPEESRKGEVNEWMVKNLAPEMDKLHPYYKSSYGFDFGRSGDLSYLIIYQEQPDLVRKTAFAIELRNVPFSQQEQLLFWIVEKLPRFVGGAMDARGNGQALAEKAAQRFGAYKIEQVMLSINWYREYFPKYKAAHEDRQIILPKSSDLLDDHRIVEVIQGVPKIPDKRTKGTDGGARHGDGVIACCLGWFASLKTESAYHAQPSEEWSNW